MNATLKKIISIVISVLMTIVFLSSAIVLVIAISSKVNTDTLGFSMPSLFGYRFSSVQTDSMEPEINVGDMIFTERLDYSDEDEQVMIKSIEIGSVITFRASAVTADGTVYYANTHKIVGLCVFDAEEDDTDKREKYYRTDGMGDGDLTDFAESIARGNEFIGYQTKGVNSFAEDEDPVYFSSILGIYSGKCKDTAGNTVEFEGTKWNGIGKVFDFLRPAQEDGSFPVGFFCIIVLPIALLFIYQIVMFFVNFSAYNTEKAKNAALEAAANAELTEEQKQKAIAEYLESIKAKDGKEPEKAPSDEKRDEDKKDEDK